MERKYSSTNRQFNDEIGSVTQMMTRKRDFLSPHRPGRSPFFCGGQTKGLWKTMENQTDMI
jgi:hypothetical protein